MYYFTALMRITITFSQLFIYALITNRDGNFSPIRLTCPSTTSPRMGFSHPAKVMGRGWGNILAPHHGDGWGWV